MRVLEALEMVLSLMERDLRASGAPVLISRSLDDPRDPGKFLIDGKVARVIHHFSGWHVPINLSWFDGSLDLPVIQQGPFHWYVFAIPRLNARREDHYFICDFLQMRDWVLEFLAPKGIDHRDHKDWLASLRVFPGEMQAYFRWGDEPLHATDSLTRVIGLDNIATIAELKSIPGVRVGAWGPGGELCAHRALKLYVAGNPQLLSLSSAALPEIEHRFRTGDRVDILFNNHLPERTVVEIEVEGEENVVTGIHQAIKYRSLAAAADEFPLASEKVAACVAAFETSYQKAVPLARLYGVNLLSVDRAAVLGAELRPGA